MGRWGSIAEGLRRMQVTVLLAAVLEMWQVDDWYAFKLMLFI